MKKYVVSLFLAVALIAPQALLADSESTTQALSMSVGGSHLIKIVQAANGADPVNISLSLGGPSEAGAAITQSATNVTTRMRMTNFASSSTEKMKITASVDGDNVAWQYSNTRLAVSLDAPASANLPNFVNYGTYANGLQGSKVLAEGIPAANPDDAPTGGLKGAQDLVTGIRTAWSGTGVGDGYIIRYDFTIVDQAFTQQPVANATVTYTLVADN